MRARQWPALEPEDFREIVRRGFRDPWWKGRPCVGVIFNPGCFENLMDGPTTHPPVDEFDAYLRSLEADGAIEGHAEEIAMSTCWIWPGALKDGYGRIGQERAHRVIYEMAVGPIPPGCDVHHECENRACVNPEHLLTLPHGEHIAMHMRPLAERTHCNYGHPMDGVVRRRSGKRQRYCKTCLRDRSRERYPSEGSLMVNVDVLTTADDARSRVHADQRRLLGLPDQPDRAAMTDSDWAVCAATLEAWPGDFPPRSAEAYRRMLEGLTVEETLEALRRYTRQGQRWRPSPGEIVALAGRAVSLPPFGALRQALTQRVPHDARQAGQDGRGRGDLRPVV